tara:strand:+ start:1142 stop:1714 length:573 start_codon:yes stop_codon:yes gene_type:complete
MNSQHDFQFGCPLTEAYPDLSKTHTTQSGKSVAATTNNPVYQIASTSSPAAPNDDSEPGTNDSFVNGGGTAEIASKTINHGPRDNGSSTINKKKNEISKKIVEYRLYLEQLNNERKYVESQLEVFQKQVDSLKIESTTKDDITPTKEVTRQLTPFLPQQIGLDDSESIINILFYIFLILFGYLLAYRLKK